MKLLTLRHWNWVAPTLVKRPVVLFFCKQTQQRPPHFRSCRNLPDRDLVKTETETRDLQFETETSNLCILLNFIYKNVAITSKLNCFQISGIFPTSFECFSPVKLGRKTDAITWSSLLRHFLKCLLNLLTWEQSLLPVLDVFGMGWVIKRPSQGAAAEMLPKTYDPAYSSGTLRGLLYCRQDLCHWAASL